MLLLPCGNKEKLKLELYKIREEIFSSQEIKVMRFLKENNYFGRQPTIPDLKNTFLNVFLERNLKRNQAIDGSPSTCKDTMLETLYKQEKQQELLKKNMKNLKEKQAVNIHRNLSNKLTNPY